MTIKKRVFVAGHNGMVGSAIVRQLKNRDDIELVLRSRQEINLLNAQDVNDFFANERIDEVYLAAAKVGGIVANNTFPADFIYENILIEANIIHAAHVNDVNKIMFLILNLPSNRLVSPNYYKEHLNQRMNRML